MNAVQEPLIIDKDTIIANRGKILDVERRLKFSIGLVNLNSSLSPEDLINFDKVPRIGQNHMDLPREVTEQIIKRGLDFFQAQRRPDEPRGHFVVPFARNPNFVGREPILAELLGRIPPDMDKNDCQRTAIEGLGGIGKTQLAIEAAFRVRDYYPDCSVFWVPAISITTFERGFRDIGRQLQLQGIDEDEAGAKTLVRTALSKESAGDWLLIVDNADDVNLVVEISEYLPFNRKGSILFTTRNHEVAVTCTTHRNNIITTTEMSRDEAHELLQLNLRESQISDAASTESLLDLLTNLPLAIQQASAYLVRTRISIASYLKLCQSSDEALDSLLSKDFKDRNRYSNTRNPVVTTWRISFEQISRDNKLAAQYLQFICFLADRDIPSSLLPPADELDKLEAIDTLMSYALISRRPNGDSFDLHRLVRLATRHWLNTKGMLDENITSVIQHLASAFPDPDHESRDVWTRYLPHAQTALDFGQGIRDELAEINLLKKVGSSLYLLGRYQQTETIYRRELQLRETLFGKEHESTLTNMDNLAIVLLNLGKYEEAEQMHRHILKLRMDTSGQKHPRTLESMNNLASVLDNQGRYVEAERILRETLALSDTVLGREHPYTLNSMNNLAKVLNSQGQYKEAEAMQRQALHRTEKILGQWHPDTLEAMDNLAIVLARQGKYEQAEIMHRHTLQQKAEILSQEHPNTLISMNNLAMVLGDQGKFQEAEKLLRQTFQERAEILGQEHPDTLISMNNLATILGNQGKYQEAEELHRKTLIMMEKVLGLKHPQTLFIVEGLAFVLEHQEGKQKEAADLYRLVLNRREEVLGKTHPDTQRIKKRYAKHLKPKEEGGTLGPKAPSIA